MSMSGKCYSLLLQIFSWAGTAGTAADLSFSAATFGANTGAADASMLATRAFAATGGSGDGVLMSPKPTCAVKQYITLGC